MSKLIPMGQSTSNQQTTPSSRLVSDQFDDIRLSAVQLTGEEIGRGAYGVVVKVYVPRLRLECAGKKLHAVFFDESFPAEPRIVSLFEQECLR